MARAMKDSGVAWIGEIPEEWEISRVGLHYNIVLGKMLCSEPPTDEYSLERYFCAANVHFDGISGIDELKKMWFSQKEKQIYQVHNGDLLIVEGGAGAGGCAIVSGFVGDAYIQNSIMIVRNKANSDGRYLRYLIEYLVKQGYIDVVCNKATIPHFTKDKLATVPYLAIPFDEQSEIANYLDSRCAKIDRVIAATQSTIEEYRKLKQSIITEAVTHGVHGPRKMKDSGVEWIGEIPEEWRISRVGLHYSIILGKMLCTEPPTDDYTLEKYFCAANVHFDGISEIDQLKEMWFSTAEKQLYRVSNGDLLVVEGGASAGGCAIVSDFSGVAYIQNSIMIVRNKTNCDSRYLRYIIEYLVKQGYIDIVCNKATIPHFTKDKLANVPYPVLSDKEQNEIADYLDHRCAEIDRLIESKQRLLTELESYKRSVIYEYVTGKREVPDTQDRI